MQALKIALALVRIPRLFASLLLFPLLASLLFVYAQLTITGVFLRATTKDADEVAASLENLNEKSFGRYLLYGTEGPLPPLTVCRWVDSPTGAGEAPPSADCALHKLDVSIQVQNPQSFNARSYERMLDGNVRRLHICRNCSTGVVINRKGRKITTDVDSIWGLGALQLVKFNTHVQKRYVAAAVELESTHKLLGKTYLHSAGFQNAIGMSGLTASVVVVMNIALLIIVALFLALKAHRKVLDYFARNGALLPMVASTGNQAFYGAIWLLTVFRVGAFLLAAVPLTCYGFAEILKKSEYDALFGAGPWALFIWILTAVISLALATVVASVADLKHRHSLLSFTYRYAPLVISAVGSALWALTFLADGQAAHIIRSVTTSVPVFGLTPLLVAPVFKPGTGILAVHAVLAAGLLAIMLKYNARWFAAHLEDL